MNECPPMIRNTARDALNTSGRLYIQVSSRVPHTHVTPARTLSQGRGLQATWGARRGCWRHDLFLSLLWSIVIPLQKNVMMMCNVNHNRTPSKCKLHIIVHHHKHTARYAHTGKCAKAQRRETQTTRKGHIIWPSTASQKCIVPSCVW